MLNLHKTDVRLLPDVRRVIAKPFFPTGDISITGRSRVQRIIDRILAMPEPLVVTTLAATLQQFRGRHLHLMATIAENYSAVERSIERPSELSSERKRLIGAYFTHEYSVDAAALSNPSMVPAPSQQGVPPGSLRFIMSLRAIGEGHVSSIQFRSGVVDEHGQIEVDPPSRHMITGRHRPPRYERTIFREKLSELHSLAEVSSRLLDSLGDHFSIEELEAAICEVEETPDVDVGVLHQMRTMHWLAASNYESTFDPESSLSARVIFPAGPTESRGMEDARFVRFTDDDGSVKYFATYTAYDGYNILPQLITTEDFVSFRMATLNGRCATNKGIALFPRRVDGRFMALARLDNENNHLIRSDSVHFWHEGETLQVPEEPWEIIQLGNCGSPIETEAGWLVITHGVGPMRQYTLGAILLDLDNPARVIGHLKTPFLAAGPDERDGYVPNVAYSCGSMLFGQRLVVPYGFSDMGARIATVPVEDLLRELSRG